MVNKQKLEVPYCFGWPEAMAGRALRALARESGLSAVAGCGEAPFSSCLGKPMPEKAFCRRLEEEAEALGLELEPVDAPYGEVEALVRSCAPALIRVNRKEGPWVLALLGCGWRQARLIAPDLSIHRIPPSVLAKAMCFPLEIDAGPRADALLEKAGVAGNRRGNARKALLQENLGQIRVGDCWLARLPPSAPFFRQFLRAGLHWTLIFYLLNYILSYSLLLLSWWNLGKAVLQGSLVQGWFYSWALLLLTLLPFRAISNWYQARLSIGIGALLKKRLLQGALRLSPEETRLEGAGSWLGRVLESESFESSAREGGFRAVVGLIETLMAAGVLALGAGGGPHALVLLLWLGVIAWLGWLYFRNRDGWTQCRIALTHDLVESMVGHETRRVQQPAHSRHRAEDAELERYLAFSQKLDRSNLWLLSFSHRGWLVFGFLALTPALMHGTASPGALALGVGGILAAYRGLGKIGEGLSLLCGARVSWNQAASLFHAATRQDRAPVLTPPVATVHPGKDGEPFLEARDLTFRYPDRPTTTLSGCNLTICKGDRLLLEGVSGGGKSTLISMLSGLRQPDSGLLLLGGLDPYSLGGENWRRRVVAAPQFHENHVFTETFAFNLLMGRRWPPLIDDLVAAEAICRELGLADLLERMPSGLQQLVGETGWRLSHGECCRVFIARALLQGAELVILDESLAALDAESLERALACACKWAPSLLVVAHP